MAVNFNHLKTFIILAQNRHFSKTAQELNIAQPAVSRQIKELEKQLQVTLFLRDNKRVELTPLGQYLAEELTPLLTGVDRCLYEISQFQQTPAGEITFSAPRELGEMLISPFITQFKKRYPKIKIDLRFGSTALVQEQVLSGEVDGGITLETNPHENLKFYKLMKQPSFLVTHKKTQTQSLNYRKLDYVAYKKNDRLLQRFIQKKVRGTSFNQINVEMYLNSHRAIVDLLIDQTDLYAVLPYYSRAVKEALDNKELKAVGDFELESDFYLVLPNWDYRPKLYVTFFDEMREYFNSI